MTYKPRPRECDQRRSHHFRSLAGKVERAEERLTILRAEWQAESRTVLEALGLPAWLDVPAYVLDVLAQVEETDDGHWKWNGSHNNHGVPTVRLNWVEDDGRKVNKEGSVYRFLHRALRGEPDRQMMHPLCDFPRCVLPQHRCHVCARGGHPLIGCDEAPAPEPKWHIGWDGHRPHEVAS